ncbi:MAG: RcnB family protein [Pseudomonadota bacterium]|nr:RcnB family protein [Pseudomonadota bacterium]
MNTKSAISGLMAVCMMASAPAFAQRYDYGNNRNDQVQRGDDGNRYQQHEQRGQAERRDGNERGERHERYERYERSERDDRYDHGHDRQAYNAYDNRRDGYRHEMRRGEQLPSEYRSGRYVVNDWRERRLSAPPRGYRWVQANNDYMLAAIATGIIAQVLLNN